MVMDNIPKASPLLFCLPYYNNLPITIKKYSPYKFVKTVRKALNPFSLAILHTISHLYFKTKHFPLNLLHHIFAPISHACVLSFEFFVVLWEST